MSVPTRRDMLFSVLFTGDEHLVRHLVWTSVQRLGAVWAWEGGVQVSLTDADLTMLCSNQSAVQCASIVRLRVMFFLLLDRDTYLKDKVLEGWPDWCVVGMERGKAGGFFQQLREQVIEPWLVDERRCDDDFVSKCIDLYLVM
jgi:hypothetical protein